MSAAVRAVRRVTCNFARAAVTGQRRRLVVPAPLGHPVNFALFFSALAPVFVDFLVAAFLVAAFFVDFFVAADLVVDFEWLFAARAAPASTPPPTASALARSTARGRLN